MFGNIVSHCACSNFLETIFDFELECLPIRSAEEKAGWHTWEKAGVLGQFRGACIAPGCTSKVKKFCMGCTRDVPGIVFVCEPSTNKRCWDILHQARVPNPVDSQGNAIPRVKLTRKRKRNSSLGTDRVPSAVKKPLTLNPHHSQL